MIKSFQKNKTGILLMLLAATLACLGQLLWKLSADSGIGYMLLGFVLYGLGAVLMLVAYRFGSLSVLQPMMSTQYVLSIILAVAVLHEPIGWRKIVGIFIIIVGVLLIGGGEDE